MFRETIVATGRGSEVYNREKTAQIKREGLESVPLEIRVDIFYDMAYDLSRKISKDGDGRAAAKVKYIGEFLECIHRTDDPKEIDDGKRYIHESLTGVPWGNETFRSAMRQLKELELTYFGESAGWLSFWDNLRIKI